MEYNWEERAVAALEQELKPSQSALQLRKLVEEYKNTHHPSRAELAPAQQAVREENHQHWEAISRQVEAATQTMEAKFRQQTSSMKPEELPRTLVSWDGHTNLDTTFAPNGPNPYALQWTDVPGGTAGVGADIHSGTFWSNRASEDGFLDAYGALGIAIVPQIPACRLWVRPYVNWMGHAFLTSAPLVVNPSPENDRATGGAQLGIVVQSTDLAGGDSRTDAQTWPELWQFSQVNPPVLNPDMGFRGNAFAPPFTLEVPASNARRYVVWVICRTFAIGGRGVTMDALASAGTVCSMPGLMVGQVY